jgi:hypothetical protein
MIIIGSVSVSYFSVGFGSGSYMNFYNILNINFTSVFASCKCVRLNIMTRYKLFRKISVDKKKFELFKLSILVENLSNFITE